MSMPAPPVTIASLLGLPSAATIRATLVQWLVGIGIRADLWPDGDAASSIVTDVANEGGDAWAPNILSAVAAGWLPTATGGWLTWLAFYVYGISNAYALRQPTFAAGTVNLVNAGGSVYSFAPGLATFQSSVANAQGVFETYTNTTAISLGALGSQLNVGIQCVDAGTRGNAAPGTITALVTSMPQVAVNNTSPVLGTDGMSDANLQALCWSSLTPRAARTPPTAYEYAVSIATNTTGPTPVPVAVNRSQVRVATGALSVVVACPEGVPTAGDVAGVTAAIIAAALPMGVAFTGAVAATPVSYSGTITLYVDPTPGLSQVAVAEVAADAVATLLANYPIGGLTVPGIGTGLHASAVLDAIAVAVFNEFGGVLVFGAANTCGPDPTRPGFLPLSAGQVAVDNVLPITVVFGNS